MASATKSERRRVAVVVVAVLLLGSAAGAAFASADKRERQDFSSDPLATLSRVDTDLKEALAAPDPSDQRGELLEAAFRLAAFESPIFAPPRLQTLHGCDSPSSREVFEHLGSTDIRLDLALKLGDNRRLFLDGARESAGLAFDALKRCPGLPAAARDKARLLLDMAVKLHVRHINGNLSDGALGDDKKKIEGWKRDLLEGQRLLSCDAYQLTAALDAAETKIALAKRIHGAQKRKKGILDAQEALTALIELWRSCGSDCTDTLDNDEDALRDADDPGCQTGIGGSHDPRDVSEQDFDPDERPPGIGCPTIPAAAIGPHNSFIRQPNAGTMLTGIILRNVTTGVVLVERASTDPDFAAGGPLPLGDAVCGPGTTATVEWSVEGLVVNWRILVAKNAPAVAPGVNRLVVAANTR